MGNFIYAIPIYDYLKNKVDDKITPVFKVKKEETC
jgi:hypothetical protein